MSESTRDFSDLIGELSSEAGRQKPLRSPLVRAIFYFVLTAAYICAVISFGSLRPDFMEVIGQAGFVFEMVMALLIWISAIVAGAWLCVPDMRGQHWLKMVPYMLTFVLGLWVFIRGIVEGATFFPMYWDSCIEHGLLLASVPLVLTIFMGHSGTTTQPYQMAIMNALVIASIGWLGLRMSCPMDDVGHGFLYQFLPLAIIGTIVGLLARRLFRW